MIWQMCILAFFSILVYYKCLMDCLLHVYNVTALNFPDVLPNSNEHILAQKFYFTNYAWLLYIFLSSFFSVSKYVYLRFSAMLNVIHDIAYGINIIKIIFKIIKFTLKIWLKINFLLWVLVSTSFAFFSDKFIIFFTKLLN